MKAIALIVAALVLPTAAQAATKHPRHHATHVARANAQPQIACTDVGCIPVRPGCYPTGGKTFSGNPSGFDVMVCPREGTTMYGHL